MIGASPGGWIMNISKESYKKIVENYTKDEPEDKKVAIQDMTKKIYEEGATPKEAVGMTDGMTESIYAHGYQLYNAGQYEQAAQLFRLLITFEPRKMKYLMGLAASQHMMKDYNNASLTYMMCSMVDKDNPLPHYHSSDCYLQLGKIGLAVQELISCIELAKKDPQYAGVRERALAMLNSLKNTLNPHKEEEKPQPEEKNQQEKKKK